MEQGKYLDAISIFEEIRLASKGSENFRICAYRVAAILYSLSKDNLKEETKCRHNKLLEKWSKRLLMDYFDYDRQALIGQDNAIRELKLAIENRVRERFASQNNHWLDSLADYLPWPINPKKR